MQVTVTMTCVMQSALRQRNIYKEHQFLPCCHHEDKRLNQDPHLPIDQTMHCVVFGCVFEQSNNQLHERKAVSSTTGILKGGWRMFCDSNDN